MTKLTPVRLARLEKGFSQYDVTKETGIPQSTLSLYEREYVEPKTEHKKALAELYGKKAEDLWK
jgi:transcriptional regulator with XRE-family HTH domain